MGYSVVPRKRNLRPRKPWNAEDIGAAPKRTLRRSRAKLSAGDFLVFDNEDDLDYEGGRVVDDDDEEVAAPVEPLTSRSRRRSARSGLTSRRKSGSSRTRTRIASPASDRSSRRALRRRRTRYTIDDEDTEQGEEGDVDEEELEDDEEELDEEDEDGYISDDDIARPTRRKSGRKSGHVSKPKVYLPEDVPGRDLLPNQPEADPEEISYNPSVAFLAIFVATFIDLFPDLPTLPSPQDIEEGLLSPEPSEFIEFLFRRMLGLVLNRKKEIEPGKYSSALSELHSLRNSLGMGSFFPPLNWKSRNNAFAELSWVDRAELLHVLAHWSLTASDRVRQLLKTLDESTTMPWMGGDEAGNHYYIVGFDPLVEGSTEHTRFRIYKETNRLLATVKWEPVASSAAEVVQFLQQHEVKPQIDNEKLPDNASPGQEHTAETVNADAVTTKTELETDAEAEPEAEPAVELEAEAEAEPEPEPEPVKYDLPDTVVEILQNFLPSMELSERIKTERLEREAKRARRKRDIQYHTEAVARGEGRYAGRFRRRRANYSDFLQQAYGGVSDNDDDSDAQMSSRSRRRLRHRGDDYAWREPEPETREQRHARLLAERAEREVQSREISEAPRESDGDLETQNSDAQSMEAETKHESTFYVEPETSSPVHAEPITETYGVSLSSANDEPQPPNGATEAAPDLQSEMLVEQNTVQSTAQNPVQNTAQYTEQNIEQTPQVSTFQTYSSVEDTLNRNPVNGIHLQQHGGSIPAMPRLTQESPFSMPAVPDPVNFSVMQEQQFNAQHINAPRFPEPHNQAAPLAWNPMPVLPHNGGIQGSEVNEARTVPVETPSLQSQHLPTEETHYYEAFQNPSKPASMPPNFSQGQGSEFRDYSQYQQQ